MSPSPEPQTNPTNSLASLTQTSGSSATSFPTSTSSIERYATLEPYPPMTTPWSAPDTCTWTYNVDLETAPGMAGPIAWLDLEPISDASTLSCYPDGMFSNGYTGTFSPGTCPNGWTTVSVEKNTEEASDVATTTVVCCSSEYSFDGNRCLREVPTVLAVPISYNDSDSTYDILTDSTTTLISATLALYTIQALFQEDDKEVLGITDEDEIETESTEGAGLSLSGRIGVGVGAAIGGMLMIGLAAWLLMRKRRSSRKTEMLSATSQELDDAQERCTPFHPVSTIRHYVHRHQEPHPLAPPIYQVSSERHTEATDEGARDIIALRAQKAAIERRIEELEKT